MIEQLELQLPHTPQHNKKINFSFNTGDLGHSSGKKKVGEYAYYLKDIIGSGYSSQVFKCHRRNEPTKTLAIKVIKLSKLAKANLQFLENEIKILQKVDHPNIIKFHNFYYTQNNCYLITDFCEGGTLQDHIDRGQPLNHGQIFQHLISGCKYLAQNLIIHRDIKPANVFKMGNIWKIGDFGFARFIQNQETVIKQSYKVGSPLYMPPQTLKQCIYSLKTDSFALGITLFNLMTNKYPWYGATNKQLIKCYKTKQFPIQLLDHLPSRIVDCIYHLCLLDYQERIFISQICIGGSQQVQCNPESPLKVRKFRSLETCTPEASDESVSQDQIIIKKTPLFLNETAQQPQYLPKQINIDLIHKIKLCKFINLITFNTPSFTPYIPILHLLKKFQKYLIKTFNFQHDPSYNSYVTQFNCQQYEPLSKTLQINQLKKQLKMLINKLNNEKQSRKDINLRLKYIQLMYVIKMVEEGKGEGLREFLGKVVLVRDFEKEFVSDGQASDIEKLIKL